MKLKIKIFAKIKIKCPGWEVLEGLTLRIYIEPSEHQQRKAA